MANQFIQGIDEVFQAFDRLNKIDYFPIADEIKNSFVQQVYIVDAIDSGDFIQAIDWYKESKFSQEHQSFLIDTSKNDVVNYSDIVERGRKDGANYPGRYPAKKGIENAVIKPIFTDSMDFVFNS